MGFRKASRAGPMTKILFHPRHVAAALDRLDAAEGESVLEALEILDPERPGFVPPEALVRLLRRCRVDPDPRLERAAAAALVRFVQRWVARKYAGLSRESMKDMAQTLLEVVSRQVAAQATIDWWEITFHRNLERAAADAYPSLFDLPPGTDVVDAATQDQVHHDEGEQASELIANAVRGVIIAKILTPREMEMFWHLFMSPIPLDSEKAAVDLVRILGKPAGTLRGIKTAIKKKLEAASMETVQ